MPPSRVNNHLGSPKSWGQPVNTHVEQADARVHQVDPIRAAKEDVRENGPWQPLPSLCTRQLVTAEQQEIA